MSSSPRRGRARRSRWALSALLAVALMTIAATVAAAYNDGPREYEISRLGLRYPSLIPSPYYPGNPNAGDPDNPLAGIPWFVQSDKDAPKYVQAHWPSRDAQIIERMAPYPSVRWLHENADVGYWLKLVDGRPGIKDNGQWSGYGQAGTLVTIATHALHHGGCGRSDTGLSRGEIRAYHNWNRALVNHIKAMGDPRMAIIVEPDGLGTTVCLNRRYAAKRVAEIRDAVKIMHELRNAAVYIDIGAADWLSAHQAISLLRAGGVQYARGFSLNPTHYDWTLSELRYGNKIASALHKHFVINTAENGRGPQRTRNPTSQGNEVWCNPPGRALGDKPTLHTASKWADAYMWIGYPGASGNCPGFQVGQWLLNRALGEVELARGY